MLRRIGFRRLLPIANLAVFLSVACFSNCYYDPTSTSDSSKPVRIPARVKVVMSLDLPAIAPVSFLAVVVPRISATWLSLVSGLFIPILWYYVGRWIDRRLGWAARPKLRRTLVRDILLIATAVVAALSILLFFQTLVLSAPYRHAHPSRTGMEVGLICWYCFLLIVVGEMLRARYFARSNVGLGHGENTPIV
jgi:hypothetical protein